MFTRLSSNQQMSTALQWLTTAKFTSFSKNLRLRFRFFFASSFLKLCVSIFLHLRFFTFSFFLAFSFFFGVFFFVLMKMDAEEGEFHFYPYLVIWHYCSSKKYSPQLSLHFSKNLRLRFRFFFCVFVLEIMRLNFFASSIFYVFVFSCVFVFFWRLLFRSHENGCRRRRISFLSLPCNMTLLFIKNQNNLLYT